MQLTDFDYQLPENLIAQHPPIKRGSSRLLLIKNHQLNDLMFDDLASCVKEGDIMVFNDTRVIKARLFGEKASGGKIEALIERVLDANHALAHIRSSKSPKPGCELIFANQWQAQMIERVGDLFKLRFSAQENIYDILETSGKLPLPPYITRDTKDDDNERYQTVYAKQRGAVAAPTAGLHFTENMLKHLTDAGVKLAYVTLHVGAGTFLPVRVENIAEHKMHCELYQINQETVDLIKQAKQNGNKVFAVGTTSLRALESAARTGQLKSGAGETDLFITPGYKFNVVDCLLTNFHLPKSTLMMLVSAFAGTQTIKNAYQHAIKKEYRFFSYGDAMLLERLQTGIGAKN